MFIKGQDLLQDSVQYDAWGGLTHLVFPVILGCIEKQYQVTNDV